VVVNLGPRTQQGRPATVELIDTSGNTWPLQVVEGSYQVQEAQRFGDKISAGTLSYQDFNPYESATVSARFRQGYGLRRYSDWTGEGDPYGVILESSNVDTRHDIAILSDQLVTETLPNSTAPVVWFGEVVIASLTTFVAVCGFAGRCVYTRNLDKTWTQAAGSTAAAPVQGAVGVFNGALVLGYGSTSTPAQYTLDGGASFTTVVDDLGGSLYIYAYTADRAAAYAAAGTAGDASRSQVMAATDGHTFQRASIVRCGNPDWPITGLAPGGGLVALYVAKYNELGEIDNGDVYRVLMPFESYVDRNGRGMRWWFAQGRSAGPTATGAAPPFGQAASPTGATDADGPAVLLVPRDRQLWIYAPSSQTAGRAQNITPWANPDIRPPNVRGETRAVMGTARWLYSIITNGTTGHSWVLVRDARSGATSVYLDLGVVTAQALGWTMLKGNIQGGNPELFVGVGNNLGRVTLPLDSEWPLDDANCPRALMGTLDLPEIDLGFPSESKIELSVQIVADGLSAAQQIQVQYSLDSGAYTVLGVAQTSPLTEILFLNPRPAARWLALRLIFSTTDRAQTPQLRAVVLRASLNAKLYRQWVFQARAPAGAGALSDDPTDPYQLIATLWAIRRAGIPVVFRDRYQDRYQVRLMELGEQEVRREPDGAIETVLGLKLLEVAGDAAATQTSTFALGAWASTWFPLTFPWSTLGPSLLQGSTILQNASAASQYPVWAFRGPAERVRVTNVNTPPGGSPGAALTWELDREILAGETVTVDFNPTRHTVLDQDGQDLSAFVAIGSTFWPLGVGSNNVGYLMDGATPASRIQLTRPV
jgi:hypothetical protein